ncbi:hypothetical protein [Sulfitobacter sp. JB4-11]|uniref:hypothetical protein n=1 Tax=Sulfitobacter rhodophyticola TaxID=3238304 RepID=UPI003519B89A
MSMAGGFLGDAGDRLLPAAIPFRFFGAAVAFHLLAWAVMFFAANDIAGFRGGTGPVLAAIHLLTLGTLTMTAIGASLQLFPVVTRRALTRNWPGHLCFALMLPAVALLCLGMALSHSTLMAVGTVLAIAGLAVFVLLTADNLRRAGSIPAIAGHGCAALVFLIVAATLGSMLIWDIEAGFLADRTGIAVLHLTLASFGFMGVLVLGLSLVLIPMFVLSRSPPSTPGWIHLGLAAIALLAISCIGIGAPDVLIWPALAAGSGAVGVYLWTMVTTLRTSMRKRLGLSFLLIRVSWGFLILALLLSWFHYAGGPLANAPALIGFVVLAGWLLTFLCGVLQRIMPFLASMHAVGKSGMPPLLSDLTAEGPLRFHAMCHFLAIGMCCAGIILDQPMLLQIGAAFGVAGATGFAIFAAMVARKVAQPLQSD